MSEVASNEKPVQKILFGSPGTGKSYRVREIAIASLGIEWDEPSKSLKNTIKTVFHPEYTYSDFMGKLLPQTTERDTVIYKYYQGHFLRALGLAYKQIIESSNNNKNVLLVIDELNRGNAAAIFGAVFQLLDREDDNWSTYEVNLSEMEIGGLLRSMGYETRISDKSIEVNFNQSWNSLEIFCKSLGAELKEKDNDAGLRVLDNLNNFRIAIPSNLSILATINTSDESIYYLDSAFKRRWDWEYVDVPGSHSASEIPEKLKDTMVVIGDKEEKWSDFVVKLNQFIKFNYEFIRRIEDKQIGWWFLKPDNNNKLEAQAIENKLMFYLWDSVFQKDRRPLAELLKKHKKAKIELITYSDFVRMSNDFVSAIITEAWK